MRLKSRIRSDFRFSILQKLTFKLSTLVFLAQFCVLFLAQSYGGLCVVSLLDIVLDFQSVMFSHSKHSYCTRYLVVFVLEGFGIVRFSFAH